jgi:hypothetical protein
MARCHQYVSGAVPEQYKDGSGGRHSPLATGELVTLTVACVRWDHGRNQRLIVPQL